MFTNWTERARQATLAAKREAEQFHHDCIDTEHLLLALASEQHTAASAVLHKLGVSDARVRTELKALIQPGPQTITPHDPPFSARAKRAIELAGEEARTLGHHAIGTDHLLLGLLCEGDGGRRRAAQTSWS